MLALGTILYLFVRALPRIEKEENVKVGFIERWITSDLPERFDFTLNNFLVKFLRRLKVLVLRIDNLVGNRLKRMNLIEKQNGAKPDWSEITGNGAKEEVAKSEEKVDNNDQNVQ